MLGKGSTELYPQVCLSFNPRNLVFVESQAVERGTGYGLVNVVP